MHYFISKVRHETMQTAARQTLSPESRGLNAVDRGTEVLQGRSQLEKRGQWEHGLVTAGMLQ